VEHNKALENCFHRCDRIGRWDLDVVVLGGCYRAVPQNALDHRIIHAKVIQIRRQAPAESMPSMPRDPGTLEHVFHFPLIASVQVERVSDCVRNTISTGCCTMSWGRRWRLLVAFAITVIVICNTIMHLFEGKRRIGCGVPLWIRRGSN